MNWDEFATPGAPVLDFVFRSATTGQETRQP